VRAFASSSAIIWAPLQAAHVGLVFGNAAYPSQSLPGCGEDAKAVHDMYADFGFHMVTPLPVLNATNDAMRKAMEALARMVQPGDTVVVHYSGHGVEDNGFHFVPVDEGVAASA
jgi:hypothetical protein